jgi:hypothetical protein
MNNPNKITEDMYIPKKINDEIVLINGFKLQVRNLIYPSAASENVIAGWELLNKIIPLKLYSGIFFLKSVTDHTTYIRTEGKIQLKILGDELEPELLELLRLCYWAYECSIIETNNTFEYKLKEIENGLGSKNHEKLVQKFKESCLDYSSSVRKWENGLKTDEENNKLEERYRDFNVYLNQYRYSISSFVAECMFAVLSHQNKLELLFIKNENKKNCDFIINSFKVEVKTIVDRIGFATDIEDRLIDELIIALRRDKVVDDINEALLQHAQIIYLNFTSGSLGLALNLVADIEGIHLVFNKCLNFVIKYLTSENKQFYKNTIPVIISASSIDSTLNYRISSFVIFYPIKDSKADPDKITTNNIIFDQINI